MIVNSTQDSTLLPAASVKVEPQSQNSFLDALSAASQKRSGDAAHVAATDEQQSASKTQTEQLVKYLNDYLRKGPMQILREKILKAMGLTEESLKQLPPEQQAKIEEAVAKKIREYLQAHNGLPAQADPDQSVMKLI